MTTDRTNNNRTDEELTDTELYSSDYKDLYQLLGIPPRQHENIPVCNLACLTSDKPNGIHSKYKCPKTEFSEMSHGLEWDEALRLEDFSLGTNDIDFNLDVFNASELPHSP